jgi:hypothetical protein
MTRATETVAALLMIVLAGRVAGAQTAPVPVAESAPAPAAPKPATNSHSRYWVVGGAGFGAARAGCPECDRDGVFSNGRSLLVDAGFRATPRLDFGVEVAYGTSKLEDNDDDPIPTTFVMGVVQVRPFVTHGFFFKTGMGAGIVGNGLYSPIGAELKAPYTTNTLALVYGAGWVIHRERRFALQVHGTHHIAALGELITTENTSIKNVVGNYWNVMVGIVFR